MKKSIVIFLIVLAALVGLVYFVTENSRVQPPGETTVALVAQQEAYSCPMHPEVVSDNPGTCPKCKMDLVKQDRSPADEPTPADKIKKAQTLLTEAKETLMEQGTYSCCIKVGCNQCALDHQSCPCYKNLKAGKPVCNECYAGWQAGEGADRDIPLNRVKTTYTEHRH